MVKHAKKLGITLLIIGIIITIISSGLNIGLTCLVKRQLNQNIASADSLRIDYGRVSLSVLSGKAWIKDVSFCTDTMKWEDSIRSGIEAHADMLSLDGINYYDWLIRRQLRLNGLTAINPTVRARFYHKTELETGDILQEQVDEAHTKRLQKLLEYARIFVDDAIVERITIAHASVEAEAINDSMMVCVSDCSLNIYDLGYNIKDLVPHYNDSVFHFLFHDIEVCIPEVQMRIEVNDLLAEPNGVLQIDSTTLVAYLNPSRTENVKVSVRKIGAGGFDVAKFNALQCMEVKNIHIYEPSIQLQIDESSQTASVQHSKTEMEVAQVNQKIFESNMEVIEEFITGLVVDTILIHDGTIAVQSISSNFKLQANNISTAVYGVGYSLIDEIPYHYNDSVYQFSLGHLHVTTPNKDIAIAANNMHYDNGGAFTLGNTHIQHIVDKWELAHLIGDIPATWIDLSIDSVYTSSKNIVKEASTLEKNFHLDTLYTNIRQLSIFRDARWKKEEPYRLPQTCIMQVSYPFMVNYVKASVKNIHIEMAQTRQNIGKMDLGPIDMRIDNVTSIRNSIITANAVGKMGKGKVKAKFDLTINPECDWHIKLTAENLNTHHLDSMIYPLVGMTIGCDIHHLQADYGGNAYVANGTMCMEYDNVDIFADKNSNSPYKIVKDMSSLINSAGKTIVHQSNPARPGKEPDSYHIAWKNDPWKNPSMFYLGPIIDGSIKNLFPGLFLSKRVKDDHRKQNQRNK